MRIGVLPFQLTTSEDKYFVRDMIRSPIYHVLSAQILKGSVSFSESNKLFPCIFALSFWETTTADAATHR